MTYMSKEELRQHLLNAPPGTTPGGIVAALRQQGVEMEGDPMRPASALSTIGSAISSAAEGGLGYLGRVAGRLTGAKQNIESSLVDYNSGKQGALDTTLQTAGNLFSAAVSPVTEASSTVVGGTLRATGADKVIASGVQSLAQTPLGQKAVGAYQQLEKNAPQQMKTFKSVGKAALDAVDTYGTVKAAEGIGKVMDAGIEKITPKVDPVKQSQEFDRVVAEGMAKGAKPQMRGAMKSSPTGLQEYNQKASSAIREIIKNKDALQYADDAGEVASQGHVPTNLSEFTQAIAQTKKKIFNDYTALSQQATGQGVQVELDDIVNKLLDYADNPVKKLADPRKTDYALRVADDLLKQGRLNPTQVEDLIAELNKSLASTYADKSAKGVSEVDLSVANALREKLDEAVFNATGEAYQPLKNAYGALKAIEKDVGHRALVVARQNQKGLIDMTDIFTGGDLAAGALTGNPALIVRALAGKATKAWYKILNSPDANIMRMFSKASRLAGDSLDNVPLSALDASTGIAGGEAAKATGMSLADYEKQAAKEGIQSFTPKK